MQTFTNTFKPETKAVENADLVKSRFCQIGSYEHMGHHVYVHGVPYVHITQFRLSIVVPYDHMTQFGLSDIAPYVHMTQLRLSVIAPYEHMTYHVHIHGVPYDHMTQFGLSDIAPYGHMTGFGFSAIFQNNNNHQQSTHLFYNSSSFGFLTSFGMTNWFWFLGKVDKTALPFYRPSPYIIEMSVIPNEVRNLNSKYLRSLRNNHQQSTNN